MEMTGQVVLVTGAQQGIGRAIALACAGAGADVAVNYLDDAVAAEAVCEAIRALGRRAVALQADIAAPARSAGLVAEAEEALGPLDVLVNNAGIAGPTGAVEEIHPEDWDRCIEVCLTSQFNCARLAVPHLRKSGNASIVNLSSAAGKFGFGFRSPYAAAKWGVIGFTRSLAIELGEAGIRVNAILPGLVAGDRQRRVLEAKAQQRGIGFAEMERIAFSYTSIKDYVTPRQLADQILFLCSRRGATISGQAISVDGDTRMLT